MESRLPFVFRGQLENGPETVDAEHALYLLIGVAGQFARQQEIARVLALAENGAEIRAVVGEGE